MPNSRCSRLNSARVSCRSLASRLVSGSSSSSSFGRRISARPMAIRCCSPPEAVPGLRSSVWPIRKSSAISPTRRWISAAATPDLAQRIGQVLADGQMRVEGEGLEDHGDPAALDRVVGDVPPREPDPPRLQPLEPGDRPQRRRLAGGTRPQQAEELARAHLEREPVQGGDPAVALDQAVELEIGHPAIHRCGIAAPPQPWWISVPSTFRHSRMKAARPGQPLPETSVPSTQAPVGSTST